MTATAALRGLAALLAQETQAYYGERLVSVAVFGSVARGTATPESDLDVLIVARALPRGRMKRVREFEAVEERVESQLQALSREGIQARLSPVLKTPEEVERGSPLFFDMTLHVDLLHDGDGFMTGYLEGLRRRMERLGSRRVRCRGGYYWLLKPDLKPGEVFEL